MPLSALLVRRTVVTGFEMPAESFAHFQDNAKTRLAAHHAIISIGRPLERIHLDHRSHSAESAATPEGQPWMERRSGPASTAASSSGMGASV